MSCYCNKKGLYRKIAAFRERGLGIRISDYPLCLPKLCNRYDGLLLEMVPFRTPSLRGMAIFAGVRGQEDIILLNSSRSAEEKNFDCGHELVHLNLHRGEKGGQFNCYDKIMPNQNSYLEWQANEGGAEILVPYRLLLPLLREAVPMLKTWEDLVLLRCELAKCFSVTETVLKIRLESLKYEIHQYLSGIPLEQVELLSVSNQKTKGINAISLNDWAYGQFCQTFPCQLPCLTN